MINIFFKKKIITKLIIIMIIVAHFSCYVSLAAEISANNYTKLTDNIVAWKNIDNADIVLANGQDISNLATKKEIEIQEEEEVVVEYKNLDLCLILDCSGSMNSTVGDTKLIDILKTTTKKLLEGLSNDAQIRVTLIQFGEYLYESYVDENTFRDTEEPYGGRRVIDLEQDRGKIYRAIDGLEASGRTPTGAAIEFAGDCWDEWSGDSLIIKKTILVTDGHPNRTNSSSRCIKNF